MKKIFFQIFINFLEIILKVDNFKNAKEAVECVKSDQKWPKKIFN